MPRWSPDGVERLQEAAFALFDERGFERTTVAEIAQRAGLTQRTFYNHFADKREVLFGLASAYEQEVVGAIEAQGPATQPLQVVVRALQRAAEATFEGRRDAVVRRHGVIAANPDLRERERTKQAALAAAVAGALEARGVDRDTALLLAGVGLLVQQASFERWARPDETRPLRRLLGDVARQLRSDLDVDLAPDGDDRDPVERP